MEDYRYIQTKKATIFGIIINLLLAVIKITIGMLGKSSALFADGVHSLSDLLSDFMVLFAAKYAHKGEDHNHPYGHERIETFATLILSAILIFVGLSIAYNSLVNIFVLNSTEPSYLTYVAAIISILGNEVIFRYTINIANKIDSDMLKANAWHSRSDMYSSIIVLVGLIGSSYGLTWMDPLAAIIVCYMIVKMGIKYGYSSVAELIDEGVDLETQNKMKKLISQTEGVNDFHCLRTRKMAGKIIVDVHILIHKHASASEGHYICELVRSNIYYNIDNIKDITVHIDVVEHDDEFIKLSDFKPSRSSIMEYIKDYLHKNNIFEINEIFYVSPKIYYLEDKIEIDFFIRKDKSDIISKTNLYQFKIKDYNTLVNIFIEN